MKVSIANNRRMIAIAIINLILLLIIFFLRINQLYFGAFFSIALLVANELAFILLLWYVISILQYWGENLSLQTPFTIFLGLQVVNFLVRILRSRDLSTMDLGLGVALAIVKIYMAVAAFRVKNEKIKDSFRVLGIILLFDVLFTFGWGMIPFLPDAIRPSRFLIIANLVQMFGILYVIHQNRKQLKAATIIQL